MLLLKRYAPLMAFTKAAPPHPAPPSVGVDLAAFVASLPTQRPLRFDSTQLVYTDGSKQGSAIGAGVYDGRRRRLVSVMPRGHAGQLNTVPKAEGTGILAALQAVPDGEDVTLLTDSLTLIHMLRSVLHNPTGYRVHKHKHMLKRIVSTMLSRQGATTSFKVRAHIGVRAMSWPTQRPALLRQRSMRTIPPRLRSDYAELTRRPTAQQHSLHTRMRLRDRPALRLLGFSTQWQTRGHLEASRPCGTLTSCAGK